MIADSDYSYVKTWRFELDEMEDWITFLISDTQKQIRSDFKLTLWKQKLKRVYPRRKSFNDGMITSAEDMVLLSCK